MGQLEFRAVGDHMAVLTSTGHPHQRAPQRVGTNDQLGGEPVGHMTQNLFDTLFVKNLGAVILQLGELDCNLHTAQEHVPQGIVALVNDLAKVLDSTPTYILGYDTEVTPITSMADVLNFLFHIEQVDGLDFSIDVNRPPHSREWQCALTFKGKDKQSPLNADMCLFLEDWEGQREELRSYALTQAAYQKWQEQTLAYYAATPVELVEPKELSKEERIRRRNEYLESLQKEGSPNE